MLFVAESVRQRDGGCTGDSWRGRTCQTWRVSIQRGGVVDGCQDETNELERWMSRLSILVVGQAGGFL